MTDYNYYLIIDLEATCCDQGSVPKREMEIIEIGAVMVEAEHLNVVDEFVTFVKPVRHPTLTNFCHQLTTIRQEDVDIAPGYVEALKLLRNWTDGYGNYLFCSWGDYDRKQFQQDCEYHNVGYPFQSGHMNIKTKFSSAQNVTKKLGLDGAMRRVGLKLEGTHHRGIDDARNMARLMPYILGKM